MQSPEKVLFGRKVREKLPELLPDGNVFIICGNHSKDTVEKELLPKLSGKQVELFSGFPAEAPLDVTDHALDTARRISARSIIGWGGGSCIDAAKTVASLLQDSERREVMEKSIAGFAPLDSNKLIFDELVRLACAGKSR